MRLTSPGDNSIMILIMMLDLCVLMPQGMRLFLWFYLHLTRGKWLDNVFFPTKYLVAFAEWLQFCTCLNMKFPHNEPFCAALNGAGWNYCWASFSLVTDFSSWPTVGKKCTVPIKREFVSVQTSYKYTHKYTHSECDERGTVIADTVKRLKCAT